MRRGTVRSMTDVRESSGSAAFTPEIAVRAVSERRDRVGFRRIFYYWGKETKEGKRAVQRQFQRTDTVRRYGDAQGIQPVSITFILTS